ncbi:MAG TPA: hypothetical protein VNC13_09875 [Propionibacteriaceae bacterium]|nr:hypothetical protein [Propionibacteriaceae bacterium]
MGNNEERRSAWWSRGRGLPSAVYESWKESLAAQLGRPARILAWATTPAGFCIASLATLSYGTEDAWQHIGWHEIEHGGWNAELRRLSWVLYAIPGQAATRGSLELTEPGRIPELFRERISATIAVEKFVPLSGERGVTVTARRDLGRGGAVSWHGTLTRGLSWQTDGVPAAVDQALEQVRAEYELS